MMTQKGASRNSVGGWGVLGAEDSKNPKGLCI